MAEPLNIELVTRCWHAACSWTQSFREQGPCDLAKTKSQLVAVERESYIQAIDRLVSLYRGTKKLDEVGDWEAERAAWAP